MLDQVPEWLNWITWAVTAATGATIITKTKQDDNFLGAIFKVINMIAGNVGNNKNADDK